MWKRLISSRSKLFLLSVLRFNFVHKIQTYVCRPAGAHVDIANCAKCSYFQSRPVIAYFGCSLYCASNLVCSFVCREVLRPSVSIWSPSCLTPFSGMPSRPWVRPIQLPLPLPQPLLPTPPLAQLPAPPPPLLPQQQLPPPLPRPLVKLQLPPPLPPWRLLIKVRWR